MSLMRLSDVARELSCSRDQVRRLLDCGRLPYVDIGTGPRRVARIPRDAFEQFVHDRNEKKE